MEEGDGGVNVRMIRPSWLGRTMTIALTLAYLLALGFAYQSSLLLYGRGQSLVGADVHRAWLTESLPWLVSCVLAIVVAHSKSFKNRELRLFIPFVASAMITIWLALKPVAYSIDITNYLWSGRLTIHGVNPYLYAPDSPHLASFQNFRYWWMLGWKSLHAAYPPVAQVYFAVSEWLSRDFINRYKVLMLLNAIVCALLMYVVLVERRIVQSSRTSASTSVPGREEPFAVQSLAEAGSQPRQERPKSLVKRYASGFHLLTDADIRAYALFLLLPPYLVESYGADHVDALAIPWLLLAWWFHLRNKNILLGAAIGIAASIKVYPIVLLAAFFDVRDWRQNAKILVSAVVVSLLTAIPFFSAGLDMLDFIHQSSAIPYNGSLQYVLMKLFGSARVAPFSTFLVLGFELAAWGFVLFTRANALSVEQKASLLGLTFILASPLVHPWYAVSFLPYAVVAEDLAVLWFAILSHLTYDEFPADMYLEYLPTYAFFVRQCAAPFAKASAPSSLLSARRD